MQSRVAKRLMSTAAVWVDKNTKLVVQGFTGKQVRALPARREPGPRTRHRLAGDGGQAES
jgi:hypothetical protein